MRTIPAFAAVLAALALTGAANAGNVLRIPVDDQTIAISGTAADPVTITPPVFGDNPENITIVRYGTLTNGKSTPITVTRPTTASVTGNGFTYMGTSCPATLAAGASCTITVKLTGLTKGVYNGTLSVYANGLKSVPLYATRAMPPEPEAPAEPPLTAWFTPRTLDFGVIPFGTSRVLTTTLTNIGSTPLTAMNLVFDGGHFTQVGTTCGASLAPKASCTITLQFWAANYFFRTSAGRLFANGSQTPIDEYWTFGAVTAPVPGVTLTDVDFGTVPSVDGFVYKDAVLTNNSGSTFTLGEITAEYFGYGPYLQISGTTCGATLPSGQSCSITVKLRTWSTGYFTRGSVRVGSVVSYVKGDY